MPFWLCGMTVTMGIWEGFCSIVWHDPYRSVHPRMTPAQPRKYSIGIVKGIDGHHKGERGFICVGSSAGS
jgi:hypothetical protein